MKHLGYQWHHQNCKIVEISIWLYSHYVSNVVSEEVGVSDQPIKEEPSDDTKWTHNVVHFTPQEESADESKPATLQTNDIKTEVGVRILSSFSLGEIDRQSSDESSSIEQENNSDTEQSHGSNNSGTIDPGHSSSPQLQMKEHPTQKIRSGHEYHVRDKKFPIHSNLEKHVRVYTGEKPFACAKCNKCHGNLNERLQKAHGQPGKSHKRPYKTHGKPIKNYKKPVETP